LNDSGSRIRLRIRLEGTVQGVGLRPFAQGLAARLRLAGFVRNDPEGAELEVEGDPDAVLGFVERLQREAPPLAELRALRSQRIAPRGERGFAILASRRDGESRALVAPDAATCPACLAEISDPADRRHRHAFGNCTHCGPRFSIVRDVPYDRSRTTMAGFEMCTDCRREYADPADRRFHAQAVCCPACGPRLALLDRDGRPLAGDPILRTAEMLRAGQLVAVKGIGGFHLAAAADDEKAVRELRERKRREERPFALLAPDLGGARRLVELDAAAERLLASAARPIVIAPRRPDAPVADAVAPCSRSLGVMLPYTPLHHLLGAAFGAPLVLTSGNPSDAPMVHRDDDARETLAALCDALLTHDRAIQVRCDDSVLRVWRGGAIPIRRSRGHAPRPLALPWPVRRPILACGGELKNTFCLAKDDRAFLSQHIGDLESWESLAAFEAGIEHFQRLFAIEPVVVAHDLHPDYLSTQYARELDGVELEGVQHHHAHAAACLAEHGHEGPVIAVCWDGLGYGPDGTLWGGEFLVADLVGFRRAGHFEPVAMPGGTAAIRQPWRMAAAYLDAAGRGEAPADLEVYRRNAGAWAIAVSLARSGLRSPLTSSVGRLFDAAAALAGVRDRVSYEGQAAAELEQRVDAAESGAYAARIDDAEPFVVRGSDLLAELAEDLRRGASAPRAAARFHNGLVRCLAAACARLRDRTGLACVALSGGVFQNAVLLERAVTALERDGFRVLVHARVPPNDGGLSLGQLAVAAARDRARATLA
jgi:hydrogenase maturation protein HypF